MCGAEPLALEPCCAGAASHRFSSVAATSADTHHKLTAGLQGRAATRSCVSTFGPHRSALLPSRPVSFHVRGFEQYGLLGLRCGEASDVQRLHSAVQGMPPLSLSRAAVAQKTLHTLSIYSCFVARCTTDLDCLCDTFPRRDARQHYLAISLASRQRTCRQRPTSTSRWW